ncbi:ribosome silencing factor [Glaciecola petra]|uniref:Ribosomal silencing factor RsfS n=1 Tax=Glaciecola petra TaxID=3075602 RepID=A0ABU2ZSF5_9ALTE|nr:ribosome silencing factor [Aestuariibacter sp. P117]MDT0594514.1 ribosome silencing factor [Aestuariibacter sp. P117]
MNSKEFIKFIVDKVDDMKARDIVIIDVSEKSTITDTLVVCSGNSKRHISSIADNVIIACKQSDHAPLSIEGKDAGEWVLVDLGELVLHVMQDETRDFFQLEKLWQ